MWQFVSLSYHALLEKKFEMGVNGNCTMVDWLKFFCWSMLQSLRNKLLSQFYMDCVENCYGQCQVSMNMTCWHSLVNMLQSYLPLQILWCQWLYGGHGYYSYSVTVLVISSSKIEKHSGQILPQFLSVPLIVCMSVCLYSKNHMTKVLSFFKHSC